MSGKRVSADALADARASDDYRLGVVDCLRTLRLASERARAERGRLGEKAAQLIEALIDEIAELGSR